ncbi:MAG TPA: transketolase C-terminal domain-containing protein, partial [Pedococcus sp.]|nr:transketolase C-terminal domain-containing protein [Pedococcus sp.]
VLDRKKYAKTTGVAKGAYVLIDGGPDGKSKPDVILIATGSEVSIAIEARETLERQGIPTRVVSMPCREWFEDAGKAYQNRVLPPEVRARVSVEAAVSFGWHDLVGDAGRSISIEHFGASADHKTLYREFGFTPEAVVKAAKDSLKDAKATARKSLAATVTQTRPRAEVSPAKATDTTTKNTAATKSAASKGK